MKRSIFLDRNLFGNDAGEDEAVEKLKDYFLITPKIEPFFLYESELFFVRARKGMGKSTLLCYTAAKIEKEYPRDIVINIKASELLAKIEDVDSNAMNLVNMWQQRICSRINNEIGKRINIAFSDDKMSVVEEAEINGFKGKNLIGALLERIFIHTDKIKIQGGSVENNAETLKRIQSSNSSDKVWLFVDDIDATFVDSKKNRLFISTFFSACRLLTNSIKGLNIRASVRTDVWALISTDESLDKCEQYMLDLKWSTKETEKILLNKISTYIKMHQDSHDIKGNFSYEKCYQEFFTKTFRWGTSSVHPFRVIHILSAGRPRWATQLCRFAAQDAYNKEKDLIEKGNINFAMVEYGRNRLSDLQKEHNHQCNKIAALTESFRNSKSEYRFHELTEHIEHKVFSTIDEITIDTVKTNDSLTIAKFLYRIGFVTLRNDEFNKAAGFTHFEEAPDLLIDTNINDDDIWIIHPAYRTALNIK